MKLFLPLILVFGLILVDSAANKRVLLADDNAEVVGSDSSQSNLPPIDCAKVPPAFWCANDELTTKCGFECKKYNETTRNKKLQLTLLYESLCPDCQEFILGSFYRDVYLQFGDFVDFELVPYGNAKTKDGKVTCQHGEKECQINKYEGCVLHYMTEPIPFIVCMESRIQDGSTLQKAAEKCYYTFKVQPHVADQIIHCVNSQVGDKFQQVAADRTAQAWPDQHKFVPWMFFNNVSLEKHQFLLGGLPTAICEFYNGDKLPSHCHGLGYTRSIIDPEKKQLSGCMRNATPAIVDVDDSDNF